MMRSRIPLLFASVVCSAGGVQGSDDRIAPGGGDTPPSRGLPGPGDIVDQLPPGPLETPEENDWFGHSVALADFNGDGYPDLAAGAPGESYGAFLQHAGAVLIFKGFGTGITYTDIAGTVHERIDYSPWALLRKQDFPTRPPKANDRFGHALAAGDFNGDGYADLAIGVPGEDSSLGDWTGCIYLAWGSSSGLGNFERIHHSATGVLPTGEDRFGWALAVGDFNGDGLEDLAIGVPGRSHRDGSPAGHVRIMLGSAEGLVAWTGVHQELPQTAVTPAGSPSELPLGSHEPGDEFGFSLAVGDLDDDGLDDLVVGAPGDKEGGPAAGAVYVFQSGPNDMRAWSRLDQTNIDWNEAGDRFGHAVAIGNFKTGSPYLNEIIVGAPGEDIEAAQVVDVGRIYAFENQGGVVTGLYGLYQTGMSDNGAGDQFGTALLTYVEPGRTFATLWASAPGDDRLGMTDSGEILPFYPSSTGPVAAYNNPSPYAGIYGDASGQRLGLAMAVARPADTPVVIGHNADTSNKGGIRYLRSNGSHTHLYQDSVNTP